MLGYLVKGRTRRELFRALWGRGQLGSVSELARSARVAFSAAHRELEAMRTAGLARAERNGSELVYQADTEHRHAGLLRQMATTNTEPDEARRTRDDERVRAWLAGLGAPLGSPVDRGILPLLFAGLAIILFIKQNKQIIFWMAVAILGFILVLGSSTPLYKFMYHVPVYNMFRASALNWLEVNFAIAIWLRSLFTI